jgi:hypothetical protein
MMIEDYVVFVRTLGKGGKEMLQYELLLPKDCDQFMILDITYRNEIIADINIFPLDRARLIIFDTEYSSEGSGKVVFQPRECVLQAFVRAVIDYANLTVQTEKDLAEFAQL